MSKKKTKKFKQRLTHALRKNRRAPVWVYLKTKNRESMRTRKRSWRYAKLKIKKGRKRIRKS